MPTSTQMRGKTPQQKGYLFEKIFGKALGLKPTKGSGNQWFAKFDLTSAHVLLSLKHTDHQSFSIKKDDFREIQNACTGDQEPALAVSIDGEVFVIQRAGDWIASRMEDADSKFVAVDRYAQRRADAKVPALLRNRDD